MSFRQPHNIPDEKGKPKEKHMKFVFALTALILGVQAASAACILNDRTQFTDQPCWVRVVFDTQHSGGPGGE